MTGSNIDHRGREDRALRRLLSLTVGTFRGRYATKPLPFAEHLGGTLVTALTAKHDYHLVPGADDLTTDTIGHLVRFTLRSAVEDDVVVVHVLGHGEPHLDGLRMVGSDSASDEDTAIDGWIRRATRNGRLETGTGVERRDGPWVLFLVDLCGAGISARQAWQALVADETRRVWVIAATGHDQNAYNGWFTQATTDVINRLRLLDARPELSHVPIDAVARAIRGRVVELAGEDAAYQRVVATRVDIASPLTLAPFFSNPWHRSTIGDAVPEQLRVFLAQLDDLADPWHFITSAAGHTPEHHLRTGYFHGRGAELRRLSRWLLHPEPRDTLRAVTANPGAGKSALLGMLVCATHPDLAEPTRGLWQPRKADLPEATLAHLYAVHAREQDTTAVIASVSRQANPSVEPARSLDQLLPILKALAKPPVIVIDAIDECHDPDQLVDLILALADQQVRNNGLPLCRLLVATRSGPHWPHADPLLARPGTQVVNLDHAAPLDLAAYVDDLLRGHPNYRTDDYLATRRQISATVAAQLAGGNTRQDADRQRWGGFLVAGIFVRSLTRQRAIHDEHAAGALQVPRTLPDVLDLDLAGTGQPWARPVLVALAHSFGAGMPRSHLRACAPLFAPPGLPAPTDDDITAALDTIRFYLRRTGGSDGISVYRPFHQSITDHLHAHPTTQTPHPGTTSTTHQHLLTRLLHGIENPGGSDRDWAQLATDYLRRHAIDHASAAGRVDELLADTEFLIHTDPETLTRHLHEANTTGGRALAAIYRTTVGSRQHHFADRRGLLAIDAARHGASDLSQHLVRPPGQAARPYLPLWATLTQDSPLLRHTLTSHAGRVVAAECTIVNDTPVAVTTSHDTTVRVWDLVDGTLQHTLTGHSQRVEAVACTTVNDIPVAVTASRDKTVRAWDLTDGTLRHKLTGHTEEVVAVACATVGGTVVAVTASWDTVRVWDLTDGTLRHTLTGHTNEVVTVACTTIHDIPVALTASWHTVRVWDLTDGTLRHTLTGHTNEVVAVACATIHDIPVALTASWDTTVRVWDLTDGTLRHTLTGHTNLVVAVACTTIHDIPVALTASWDTTVRVWDLTDDTPHHIVTGHTNDVVEVDRSTVHDIPFARTVSWDTMVRWDLNDNTRRHILGHPNKVVAVACTTIQDVPVAVTVSWNVMRVWDLTHGTPLRTFTGHTATAVVCTTINDIPVAVTIGSNDATVRVWDLTDGTLLRALTGHTKAVEAVACTTVNGIPVAVTASWDETTHVWDLTDGGLLHTLAGRALTPFGVACTTINDIPIAVTTSFAEMHVWDLTEGALLHTLTIGRGGARAVACTTINDLPVAVTTAWGDATVRVWDLTDGTLLHTLAGHTEAVVAVACATVNDIPVAVSTSADATIRVWDLAGGGELLRQPLPHAAGPVAAWQQYLVLGFGWEIGCLVESEGEGPYAAAGRGSPRDLESPVIRQSGRGGRRVDDRLDE